MDFVSGEILTKEGFKKGYIEFNKRLANFSSFEMVVSYRPYITVNRPVYHVQKQRIGITSNVTYTWRLREDASTEMSLIYPRELEGTGNNLTFRFITGGEKQPISYNTIFDGVSVSGTGQNENPPRTNDRPKETSSKNSCDSALNQME